MKNKNILVILLIVVFVLAVCVALFVCIGKRNYTLNLPSLNDIESISMGKSESLIVINYSEEIKNILDILNSKKRVTNIESVQDMPVNASNQILIQFYLKENKVEVIYLYEKNNCYYIEKPYNGIYEITSEEYNLVKSYCEIN